MKMGFIVAMGLLVLALPRASQACAVASHHWRIVLGDSPKGLVVLDLPLFRDERELKCKLNKKDRFCRPDLFDDDKESKVMGHKLVVGWKGTARLALFLGNGRELRALVQLQSLRTGDFFFDVRPVLAQAQRAAGRIRGFVPLAPPIQDFCEYSRVWGRYELVSDDKGQLSLSLTQASQVKQTLPIALPDSFKRVISADSESLREAATALRIMSVLSYDLPGGEVLVLDIGQGDEIRAPVGQAAYPPCGCSNIADCVPLPETMHHGTQIQAIVRSALPAPSRPRAEESSAPGLSPEDFDRARKLADFRPRTDGVYLSAPTCSPKSGWSRVALRFFDKGHAAIADGNLSSTDAFILTSDHYRGMRTGTGCNMKGAHIRCELGFGLDEPEPDPNEPRTSLEGIGKPEGLDVRLSPSDGSGPTTHSLRFVPLTKDRIAELDE